MDSCELAKIEIKDLEYRNKSLNSEIGSLCGEIDGNCERIRKLQLEIILANKLLTGSSWLVSRTSFNIMFSIHLINSRDDLPDLVKLLNPDHHDHYIFNYNNKTITLHFCDDDVYLECNDIPTGINFVKESGIKLDGSYLNDEYTKTTKYLSELQSAIEEVRKIQGV